MTETQEIDIRDYIREVEHVQEYDPMLKITLRHEKELEDTYLNLLQDPKEDVSVIFESRERKMFVVEGDNIVIYEYNF